MTDAPMPPDERFARTRRLLGTTGMERLAQAHVTVCGLGAVGSFAVEALARMGVGHLRLIDCDVVSVSNINRQLYALGSTVGQRKCDLAAARVRDINPACVVEAWELFVGEATMAQVLTPRPDVLIDAIDALGPKTGLLMAAQQRGIKVFSAMGAATRTDPAAVRLGPLEQVTHCPLAFHVRKRLRRAGAGLDITCVYSNESRHPTPEVWSGPPEVHPAGHRRGRPRASLGSLPTITGIFGLMLAHGVMAYLTGAPAGNPPVPVQPE